MVSDLYLDRKVLVGKVWALWRSAVVIASLEKVAQAHYDLKGQYARKLFGISNTDNIRVLFDSWLKYTTHEKQERERDLAIARAS